MRVGFKSSAKVSIVSDGIHTAAPEFKRLTDGFVINLQP